MTRRPVPSTLRDVATHWKGGTFEGQPSTGWSRETWVRWLPEHADYLEALPAEVTRARVVALCADAGAGPDEATRAFVAAMVWGYGRVGYGAFRTRRVLTENADSGETLAMLAGIARAEGGPAAFEWLAEHRGRLRWLGVAFATKFLFFCADGGDGPPALVLDALVRRWLAVNANWSLSLQWNVGDYSDYVDTVCTWSQDLEVSPANVEMLMFQLAVNATATSQWQNKDASEGKLVQAPTAASSLSDETTALLELFDVVAEAFSSLPGPSSPEDTADFEQGVRQLRRIALTRG